MMPQHVDLNRHVFVYGTLRQGGSNDIWRFDPKPRFIGFGRIRGLLFDLGAYPGARLDGEGWIVGEVYAIEPLLEAQLDILEEVDGDQGEYVKRQVWVELGESAIECLVYEIHSDRITGRRLVPEGDWLRHLSSS